MYATDIIWWGFTLYIVLVALFVLWFALKVRQKGG